MKIRLFKNLLWVVLLISSASVQAKDYYVSPQGNDSNPGIITMPFKTIQKAAEIMVAGDVCYIRQGVYHESVSPVNSGEVNRPIRFMAYNGENVILNGAVAIESNWKKYKGKIYKTKVEADKIEQLFADTAMMIEARWPNMKSNEIFDRTKWAAVDYGSKHGMLVSEAIAKTGIDWTGAQAYLNVAHQWWTWCRPITAHKSGSKELYYAADLVGLCNYTPEYRQPDDLLKAWADDYFYLFGKLEALDVEKEWYFDSKTKEFYFYAPEGKNPADFIVRYKTTNYGFYAKDKNYIFIQGINFFACTFRFEDCNYCGVSNSNLKYPTYSRTITEYDQERKESVITKIVGDYNKVDHISLSFSNNMGLMIMGNYNEVTNSNIHDINWSGTLIYPALQLSSSPHLGVNWFNTIQYPPTPRTPENSDVTSVGNVAGNNTLFNCGGPILVYHASKSIVEYNHIYNGGLACKDVSLVYGCWPFSHSSIVGYNWVHGCRTEDYFSKSITGGLGIRCDDQSRHNIFHHNVVWECGDIGIVAKGDDNYIYNNTVFNSKSSIELPQKEEPFKMWAVQWPRLLNENFNSRTFNNLVNNIRGSRNPKDSLAVSPRVFNNFIVQKEFPLNDISKHDFRPVENSSIIDSGVIMPYVENKFEGKAPDIGAYEAGGENWIPGAKWSEDNQWSEILLMKKNRH